MNVYSEILGRMEDLRQKEGELEHGDLHNRDPEGTDERLPVWLL